MAPDLFEQLANMEVPPPPAHFDAQLHDKVNRSLVASHLVDLVLSGFPWACGHFARALIGMICYTLTGRYESKPPTHRR